MAGDIFIRSRIAKSGSTRWQVWTSPSEVSETGDKAEAIMYAMSKATDRVQKVYLDDELIFPGALVTQLRNADIGLCDEAADMIQNLQNLIEKYQQALLTHNVMMVD